MIKFVRFNIYLFVALALLVPVNGCKTDKKKKNVTILELHLEASADGSGDNESVQVFRDPPISVNVDKESFLDGEDVEQAKVVDELGGYVIQLKFNWRGTQLLSSITAANRGKRIAVLCVFGEARWLAAPVIRKAINDGVLKFTPDASREEADRIVKGLNDVAVELKKSDKL